jgi:hypothetical protein
LKELVAWVPEPGGRLSTLDTNQAKRFNPVAVVAVILIAVFLISRWAVWYGNAVSIPRYCAEPEHAVDYLRAILSHSVVDNENRRTAMIAAKIQFLLPREPDEPVAAYVERVRRELNNRCQ